MQFFNAGGPMSPGVVNADERKCDGGRVIRISLEIMGEYTADPPGVVLRRREQPGAAGVYLPLLQHSDAPAHGLELDEAQRLALQLPPCEAVNGGTHLCIVTEAHAHATGVLPRAPQCWDELVAAEWQAMGGDGPSVPWRKARAAGRG